MAKFRHIIWGDVEPDSEACWSGSASSSGETRMSGTREYIVNKALSMKDLQIFSWSSSSSEKLKDGGRQLDSLQRISSSNSGSSKKRDNDCDPNNCLPSVGSAKHAEGTCKPCLYMMARHCCPNGSDCGFCHDEHCRKNTARPCKAKRDRFRKLLEKGTWVAPCDQQGQDPEIA